MPAPHPPQFRQSVIDLYRKGDKTVAVLAKELGISQNTIRNWITQDEADNNGGRTGLTSAEKKELAELRKRNRALEVELDILRKAAAYFARENVLPK